MAELRYSLRSFAKSPALTTLLVLTIAAGVGGNAMVYGFIKGSLGRRGGAAIPSGVSSVFVRDERGDLGLLSPAHLDALRRSGLFEAVGAYREDHAEITQDDVSSMSVVGAATPEFFSLRDRAAKSPSPGQVVVSYSLWRDVFGAPDRFKGRVIDVDGRPLAVSSILPESLGGVYAGHPIDAWMLLEAAEFGAGDSGGDASEGRTLSVLGRLRPGIGGRAAADMLTRQLGATVSVVPYTGVLPGVAGGASRVAGALTAASAVVFLIACANIAAFLLSRAAERAHETSVRVAIGATRRQIARQLMSDALIIAPLGSAAGSLLAFWLLRVVPALFFAEDAEHLAFNPGRAAIVIAASTCCAIVVVCSLAALLEVRDDEPATVLRREGAVASSKSKRVRSVLVSAQLAACCSLILAAGLMVISFRAARRTELGRRIGQPVVGTVTWSGGFGDEREGRNFYDRVLHTVTTTAGVTAAAWTSALPGAAPAWTAARVEPRPSGSRDVRWQVEMFPAPKNSTTVITRKAGRLFGGRDAPGACPSIVVSESAAAELGPDPVGRVVTDPSGRPLEVIGVVSLTGPHTDASPTMLFYREQGDPPYPPGEPVVMRVMSFERSDSAARFDTRMVSSGYFDMVGAGQLSGEPITSWPPPCRVAAVNAEAEQRFFDGRAVGRAIVTPSGERVTIVQVVKTSALTVDEPASAPGLFLPLAQSFSPRLMWIAATAGRVGPIVADMQQRVRGLGSQAEPARAMTLDEHLSRTALAPARISSTLMAVCAVLAALLAVIGVYGSMAEAVRRRHRELALRSALGAPRWRLMALVVGDALKLAAVGAATGAVAGVTVVRWLLPVRAGASVWPIWLATPAVLALIVVIAAVLPAGRAAHADPLTLLKER